MKKISIISKSAANILLNLIVVLFFLTLPTMGMEKNPDEHSSQIAIHQQSVSDTERSKAPLTALDLSGKYREYDEEGNFVKKAHPTWSDYTYWWNYAPRDNVDYAYHYARLSVDIWTKCNGINMPPNDLTRALNYARRAQTYAEKDNIFPYLQNKNIDISAINNLRINLERDAWHYRLFDLEYYIPLTNKVIKAGIKSEIPFKERKKVLVAGFYGYRPHYMRALGIDTENIEAPIGAPFFGREDCVTKTKFQFWELTEQERYIPFYFSQYARSGSAMLCFFNSSKIDDSSLSIFESYYDEINKYNNQIKNAIKIILLGIGDGFIGDLSEIEKFKSQSNLFICLPSAKETYQKEYVSNMLYAYILEDEQRIKETQKKYLIQKPNAEEYIFFERNKEEDTLTNWKDKPLILSSEKLSLPDEQKF